MVEVLHSGYLVPFHQLPPLGTSRSGQHAGERRLGNGFLVHKESGWGGGCPDQPSKRYVNLTGDDVFSVWVDQECDYNIVLN